MTIADYTARFPDSLLTLANLSEACGGQEAMYDAFFDGDLDDALSEHIRRYTTSEYLVNRSIIRAMGKLADAMDALREFLAKKS